MKYAWLILSYTVILVSVQEDRIGDLYLAEKPYVDWFSAESCTAYKGKPCNMSHCVGGHYANALCCCDVQLDLIPPEKPVFMVADVPVQVGTPPEPQPDDKTLRQTMFEKIKNCLGLGS